MFWASSRGQGRGTGNGQQLPRALEREQSSGGLRLRLISVKEAAHTSQTVRGRQSPLGNSLIR